MAEDTKAIMPSHFGIAEFGLAQFVATIPAGWKFEECLRPEFWVHVCPLFKRDPSINSPEKTGSLIHILAEDHAFYAQLYVLAVQSQGLTVKVIIPPVPLQDRDVKSDKYEVRWSSSRRGFDIIRKSDKSVVADGSKIKTKDEAAQWIAQGA